MSEYMEIETEIEDDDLTIDGQNMILVRDPEAPWHSLVSDISATLKDFFL